MIPKQLYKLALDLLTIAEFIRDKKYWCQGSYARLSIGMGGKPVYLNSSNACRWCASGAEKLLFGYNHSPFNDSSRLLRIKLFPGLISINDKGHTTVLRELESRADRLIEMGMENEST